jgi:hypothetical protein
MEKRIAKQKRKEANKIFMGTNTTSKNKKKDEVSNIYFGEKKSSGEEDLEDLDEDQIVKIFKEENIYKKSKEELIDLPMWVDIYCESSMYLFDKVKPTLFEDRSYNCLEMIDHYFKLSFYYVRLFCYKSITSKVWEPIV